MLSLKFLYNNPLGSLLTGFREKVDKNGGDRSMIIPANKDPTLDSDPLRASYVLSIPRAQWFRGVLLQGYMVPSSILRGLDDFEIREDDIFIVTYPKSGTTWTEEIVSLVMNDGDLSKVKDKLLIYRVEHLEVGRPIGHLKHLRKLKSPRLMATHLPLPLIPKQLRQAKCKIIYIIRNPKDNAVSYYHHHRMSTYLGNFKGTWEEFLAHYLRGHMVYGSWFDHVIPYWKFSREHPDKMLFISFEELKMDLPGMVSRIGEFLGHSLKQEAIDTIANHCSFEQMKNNNMVNREVLPLNDLFDMTKSKFMRKGIIGDWKNYFTAEQNEVFHKLYDCRMRGSGLSLAFEPDEAFRRMGLYGRILIDAKSRLGDEENEKVDKIPNGDVVIKGDEGKRHGIKKRSAEMKGDLNNCRSSFITIPSLQPYAMPDPLVYDVVF